ncbi:glycoside hydrolase family 127 protein [Runella sp. MFBS21]|uniref:glycoside hydrolase family 127 protein n=1 Tax=Runella sp. MFBS21 TaxID=3034018 RepID=UPI0023F67E17|nr:glycoside hydrolase family 127 protein [Runella sp. MFBS21]MDF7821781.1 glycoside hydrolase family 127 protein [Runella sp. MFBS21]
MKHLKKYILKLLFLHTITAFLLSSSAFGQMQPFTLQEVKVTNGAFKNAQDVDMRYILSLNPDKLLAPYLIDAGLPLKAERYGNWESSGLDGHIGGHYLSALAMMYASTVNTELKKRLDYMVDQLAQCQAKNGNGYVGGIPQGKVFWERIHKGDIDGSSFGLNNTWVPLYNIHKLFAGLRDAYEFAGNQQAKQVLIGLGDWFIELIQPLSDAQTQQILRTEHGGINETFADLYILTKNKKYLDAALKLSHQALLTPLLAKQDKLTGLHANTQIPKVIGYEKIAMLTGKTDWSEAARFFWQNVSQARTVAFGGNSVREHFNPTTDFSGMLKSNQGPETCNSFNMLRLSKALFLDKNDPSYLDFYERTLYNHILSSQHPQKGGFVYFTPIRPNHYRVYSQPETSMWCCVGSGIENHTKYGELIYSHSANDLFVNLFIPSLLNWKENNIQLTQSTTFPYKNQTELVLKLAKSQAFTLNIRYPKWAENVEVLVNGKTYPTNAQPSHYIGIQKKWKSGDKVTVQFTTSTKLEYLPDNSNWTAFVYGPIVLAAKTSTSDLVGLFADDSRMGHETKGKLYPIDKAYALIGNTDSYLSKLKLGGNLTFSLDSLTLQPFYEIHDARYQMYFQTFTQADFEAQKATQRQQEVEALALEARTVDKVNCGEQQPEVNHSYKGEKSDSGYDDDGRFWRNTRSYISYQLQNKDSAGKTLEIHFSGNLKTEEVGIFINDRAAEVIAVKDKVIVLKADDKEVVHLKIVSENGRPTPRFHQIRIVTL